MSNPNPERLYALRLSEPELLDLTESVEDSINFIHCRGQHEPGLVVLLELLRQAGSTQSDST